MKSGEIKDLSVEDLREKIGEMEVVQEKLVLTHQISPLENPLQLRWSRRDIARLKTELRKRELQA
jgi:large subunit ribosomal protein L29|tara:strand:- start:998 stop:1192 length:195 start_codon:yes stop_codon:yes gene_type:complete